MFRLFFLQSTINIRVTYIIGSRTVSLSRSSMTTKKIVKSTFAQNCILHKNIFLHT